MIDNDRKVFEQLFRQVGLAMECGIEHMKSKDPHFGQKIAAMAVDGFRVRMIFERNPDCQARLEMFRVDSESNVEAVTVFEFRESPPQESSCNRLN